MYAGDGSKSRKAFGGILTGVSEVGDGTFFATGEGAEVVDESLKHKSTFSKALLTHLCHDSNQAYKNIPTLCMLITTSGVHRYCNYTSHSCGS